jgi:hypothetical protein
VFSGFLGYPEEDAEVHEYCQEDYLAHYYYLFSKKSVQS